MYIYIYIHTYARSLSQTGSWPRKRRAPLVLRDLPAGRPARLPASQRQGRLWRLISRLPSCNFSTTPKMSRNPYKVAEKANWEHVWSLSHHPDCTAGKEHLTDSKHRTDAGALGSEQTDALSAAGLLWAKVIVCRSRRLAAARRAPPSAAGAAAGSPSSPSSEQQPALAGRPPKAWICQRALPKHGGASLNHKSKQHDKSTSEKSIGKAEHLPQVCLPRQEGLDNFWEY